MNVLHNFRQLLRISRSQDIARRYFVVNGFDGTLAMLGLTMGFLVSDHIQIEVVISACLGTSIALGVSGISSAYISEAAERKRELKELEQAVMANLEDSAHGRATFWVPIFIAFINGASPLLLAQCVMLPLWLDFFGFGLPLPALWLSIIAAFVILFLLGAFLGKISQTHWLLAGARTLLIAMLTSLLVWILGGL